MRRRGFTLIEVVLARSIAGLLVLGGVTTVVRLIPRLRLQSGIWDVTTGLNQARFRAILSGAPVRVRFASPGFSFEIYDGMAGAWRTSRVVPLPGVFVRANNAPVFYPQGTVSDLASIAVWNARGAYRITIALTGRIKTVRTG